MNMSVEDSVKTLVGIKIRIGIVQDSGSRVKLGTKTGLAETLSVTAVKY